MDCLLLPAPLPASPQGDLYSLGVVLYEMWRPFQTASAHPLGRMTGDACFLLGRGAISDSLFSRPVEMSTLSPPFRPLSTLLILSTSPPRSHPLQGMERVIALNDLKADGELFKTWALSHRDVAGLIRQVAQLRTPPLRPTAAPLFDSTVTYALGIPMVVSPFLPAASPAPRRWLLTEDPTARPTAMDVLNSEFLPPPLIEEAQIHGVLRCGLVGCLWPPLPRTASPPLLPTSPLPRVPASKGSAQVPPAAQARRVVCLPVSACRRGWLNGCGAAAEVRTGGLRGPHGVKGGRSSGCVSNLTGWRVGAMLSIVESAAACPHTP